MKIKLINDDCLTYLKKLKSNIIDLVVTDPPYIIDTSGGGIYNKRDYQKSLKEIDNGFNHGITLVERKNIVISGVKKIESFDSEEFLMETTLGYLVIKGNELEIIKLDTYQGNVSIKGKIDSMVYLDSNNKKDNDNSLLNKLFKWF